MQGKEFIDKLLKLKGEVEIVSAIIIKDVLDRYVFNCTYMLPYNDFEFYFEHVSPIFDEDEIVEELNADVDYNLESMINHCADCKDSIKAHFRD